jgi:hypothetical protein
MLIDVPVPPFRDTLVVAVLLPIAIALVPAVPILMFWLTASLPIEITPAEELSSKTPAESKSNVSADATVISPAPVDAKAIPAVPELITT